MGEFLSQQSKRDSFEPCEFSDIEEEEPSSSRSGKEIHQETQKGKSKLQQIYTPRKPHTRPTNKLRLNAKEILNPALK